MTKFQDICYKTLQINVPAGKVISYKNLAILTGNPRASRAVGNAMNKNPFAPHVPCHRVVKSDGSIGGLHQVLRKKFNFLKKKALKLMEIGKLRTLKSY